MNAWFVTGTDTGVGKTLIAAALMHRLRERFARVAGMKPIAAGSLQLPDGRWSNEDVIALRDAASVDAPLSLINPYLLAAPVSPHIAAQREAVTIEIERIVQAFATLQAMSDAVVDDWTWRRRQRTAANHRPRRCLLSVASMHGGRLRTA